MKKLNKKDLLLCTILAISFIVFVLIITQFKFYYGSTLDWESQHSTLPEYFRLLFYKTRDFFPDFAFNLGNGQNIYNFSYYGLLSPIIMISYLFPDVNMLLYIIISSIIVVIVSSILLYIWLRRNRGTGYFVAFFTAFALMFSTALSFHSHRHIMFINYMPFLIMGLFGVDKKLVFNKSWLLAISVLLMIMTSYYYSISGIICLVLYGIYKYIELNPKITVKGFFKDGVMFSVPILLGIMSSMIIILPTFYVILTGRGETFNTITLKDLIVPGVNVDYLMYDSYGMGLTSIVLVAIVHLLFQKREKRFLGVSLALMLFFPLVNYILNATMYIDAKVLIPMLPLAMIAIYIFMSDAIAGNIEYKKVLGVSLILAILVIFKGSIAAIFYIDLVLLVLFLLIHYRFKKTFLLCVPLLTIPLLVAFTVSFGDELVVYDIKNKTRDDLSYTLKYITKIDKSFYRISNAKTILRDVNNMYGDIDYYTSTLYSSTYNMAYNKFYYDVMNNPIQNRNRVITSATANILYLMFSGNKYIIDNVNSYQGYDLLSIVDDNKVYKNEDVLPLIYARSQIMSEKDFSELGYPYQMEALLKNVVVGDESSTDFMGSAKKVEIDWNELEFEKAEIEEKDDYYSIDAKSGAKATYELPKELQGKILFIKFRELESNSCSDGDSYITINNVKNKLTCKEWKYHNQNYEFDYTLAMKDLEKLKIEFSSGIHKIKDIEVFAMDYEDIKNIRDDVDEFIFDKKSTKGDLIKGTIDVTNDGYVVSSIPYDKGFNITVDGEPVECEKVNKAFVGFKISSGEHEIEIEYRAPFKDISLEISYVGILSIIGLAIFELLHNKK